MIGKIMTTTALLLVLSGGAIAADNTSTKAMTTTPASSMAGNGMMAGYTMVPTDELASKLIGMQVYDGTAQNAQQIGTVKDLVINATGGVQTVVVGVGGFLGVGQKDVAIDYPQLHWMAAVNGNPPRVTINTTKDALNAAPTFKYPDDMSGGTAMTNGQMTKQVAPAATGMATTMTPATGTDANSVAAANSNNNNAMGNPEVDPSKLTPIAANTMKSDDLKGTDVISSTGQKLGSIGDFILTKNGKVDAVLVDFGGFLGIGTKTVAVGYDGLKFMTDGNNHRYVEVNLTKAQLNAQEAYNKDTYATDRAQQRLMVTS